MASLLSLSIVELRLKVLFRYLNSINHSCVIVNTHNFVNDISLSQ